MGNSSGGNGFSLKMYRLWPYDHGAAKDRGEKYKTVDKKYSLKDLQYWDKYVRIQNCDKF